MDKPVVEIMSRAQLWDRHAQILNETRMSESELRRRADEWTLSEHEAALYGELRQIHFLLGN